MVYNFYKAYVYNSIKRIFYKAGERNDYRIQAG